MRTTEQFPGEGRYWRPKHTCQVLRTYPTCTCGAMWGLMDKWGGRTRVNEDGTPWKRSVDMVGYDSHQG